MDGPQVWKFRFGGGNGCSIRQETAACYPVRIMAESESSSETLTTEAVLHVAKLARLRLAPDRVEPYRLQLASVLQHIAHLSEFDVEGVEPMAHPAQMSNRLDEDVVGRMLTPGEALANAPAVKDDFIVVPKVLGADVEGGG